MRCEEKTRQRMRNVAPICNSCQDCEDLLSITPPQSVKIQQYIRHLETEGISRVKMYMIITAAYLIFWAPLFLVSWDTNWTLSQFVSKEDILFNKKSSGDKNLPFTKL